ncbi:MAG: dUTP pyrophosphatase [Candidatus Tokpelaia sp. JSC161]|jgi:dUTP pyrophosphatase|nr:MAG: dUTP pyrophosphatase [Candidatus Tokpelaia sp. JSC161]
MSILYPTLSIVRLPHAKDLKLPSYETIGAAGLDLRAAVPYNKPIILFPLQRILIPTGLIFEVPQACEAQIRPRSGLALKYGISCLNSPGTIDSDYRGEIHVLLINLGQQEFSITRGMRIAQAIIAPILHVKIIEQKSLSQSKRDTGAFGSTGED